VFHTCPSVCIFAHLPILDREFGYQMYDDQYQDCIDVYHVFSGLGGTSDSIMADADKGITALYYTMRSSYNWLSYKQKRCMPAQTPFQ
jgi:hypothetical protein